MIVDLKPGVGHTATVVAMNDNSIFSKLSQLMALCVVYLFLSGWAFLDAYYRFFGLNPRWLDMSLYDVLTKGFTILFRGGGSLWPGYVVVVLVPIGFESITALREKLLGRLLRAAFLLAMFVPVFVLAERAGQAEGRTDKSDNTKLPAITFTITKSKQNRSGKLLYAKG